jgi:predicted pyridoxine 5'-phosphate oxidase superfamily flavin-nucleotide-binding protein
MMMLDRAARTFMPTRRESSQRGRHSAGAIQMFQECSEITQYAWQSGGYPAVANRQTRGPVLANQAIEYLTPVMQQLVQGTEMAFIATSDSTGECDCSFRVGPAGFVRIVNYRTIAYPEYQGGGVVLSAGNMRENPHVSLFLVDCTRDLIGLHVNGTARVVTPAQMLELDLDLREPEQPGFRPVRWIVVRVSEAYVHCSTHIPVMIP